MATLSGVLRGQAQGPSSPKFGRANRARRRGRRPGTKIKFAAHACAKETERSFHAAGFPGQRLFFSWTSSSTAFGEGDAEKIDDIRDHLRHAVWGKRQQRIDLHYVLGYNHQIMPADEIINRTFEIFTAVERPITSLDGDTFVVHNHDVATIPNHRHFIELAQKEN
jgi:hypothetical protein